MQWLKVTNSVWWQDFPCLSVPDYLSLFLQSSYGDDSEYPKSDFAAQLAGFVASLVVDVPNQAHWILELSKYNFTGALVHLIASVPGIYTPRSPYMADSKYFLSVSSQLDFSVYAQFMITSADLYCFRTVIYIVFIKKPPFFIIIELAKEWYVFFMYQV